MGTAGLSTTAEPSKRRSDAGRGSFWRSATARIALLVFAFASFPAIVYRQLPALEAVGLEPAFQRIVLAYLVLTVVVFIVVFGLVRNLRRLDQAVRLVRIGTPASTSFDRFKRVPELAAIAGEFERMAGSLRSTAEEGRMVADEKAHAFKTPIATITHALVPLQGAVAADNARARRSLELIEQTAKKLDALVVADRRMEQARCRILHPARWRLDLGAFVRDAVASKKAFLEDPRPDLKVEAESGIHVYGNDDILETIVDNIIDNAVGVTRPSGRITVTVERRNGDAVCCIEDEGPGLPEDTIDRAFDPYASYRPGEALPEAEGSSSRFGIGLWVVRRNVEALSGRVWAENRTQGGLRVVMTLPLA